MTLELRTHALHLMVVFDNLVPFKEDEHKYITESYFVTYSLFLCKIYLLSKLQLLIF